MTGNCVFHHLITLFTSKSKHFAIGLDVFIHVFVHTVFKLILWNCDNNQLWQLLKALDDHLFFAFNDLWIPWPKLLQTSDRLYLRERYVSGWSCFCVTCDPISRISRMGSTDIYTLIARFMGPTWGPSGADRTRVGPMLAPWTLLSG